MPLNTGVTLLQWSDSAPCVTSAASLQMYRKRRSLDSSRTFDSVDVGKKKECKEMIDGGMQSKQEGSEESE